MQNILTSLINSFHVGVPALVYDATCNLILKMYGHAALDHFAEYILMVGDLFYFRHGSPPADDFIQEFEKIS